MAEFVFLFVHDENRENFKISKIEIKYSDRPDAEILNRPAGFVAVLFVGKSFFFVRNKT